MASVILVREVMSKNVKAVQPDSSVKEAVASMNKFNIGSILVVQDNKPVGIVSERDILRRVVEPCLSPENLTVGQIMTSPVYTISEMASINEAAKLMAMKKVRKIPVIKKKKLVGIITYTDIVKRVLSMLSILEELI